MSDPKVIDLAVRRGPRPVLPSYLAISVLILGIVGLLVLGAVADWQMDPKHRPQVQRPGLSEAVSTEAFSK